jgi:response regulator RpfG family c-di-GMP phosphodiesterase
MQPDVLDAPTIETPATDDDANHAILAVDDDPAILSALTRLLRPDGLQVLTATSGADALHMLEESTQPIGVLISDYSMPGMTGAELLHDVRLRWPDITRVLLTGNADMPAAAKAVNDGQLSRLYLKPWHPDDFRRAIAEALEQHRMLLENQRLQVLATAQGIRLEQWNVQLERQVAERTVELQKANEHLGRGMLELVRLLQTFLVWRLPERATECKDVARFAGRIAEVAGMSAEDARRIQVAALVHDIGLLRLQDHLLRRPPAELTLANRLLYQQHPMVGSMVLSAAEPLADMASWIRSHHERWDGKGYPEQLVGPNIPLGARIIALADGYRLALSEEGGTAPRWRSHNRAAGAYDPDLMMMLDIGIAA